MGFRNLSGRKNIAAGTGTMKKLGLFALCLCLLGISSCRAVDGLMDDIDSLDLPVLSMDGEPRTEDLTYSGSCPEIRLIEELASYSEFSDSSSTRDSDLVSRVKIADVKSACHTDERTVTADLKLAFEGVLGPQARQSTSEKPFFAYPFFVAIASPEGKILAKEVFAAGMAYPAGQNRHVYYENIRQIIPIEARDHGRPFKILLGFQLGPDQLEYNRKLIKAERKAQEAARKAAKEKARQEKKSLPPVPAPAIERESLNKPTDLTGGQ